ncbi:MAG TPA: hypothetical protein VNW06_02260 [Cytophagaceae bacterium]|jgi:hypothetical protein|nr:hypothetical protein [Cytophagaceae bacterium]
MTLRFIYILLLSTLVNSLSAQNLEPKTGSLSTLNKQFHADYNQLVNYKISHFGDSLSPVMVFAGDTLIFKYKGKREAARIIPLEYHQLKAIDHLSLGIFTLVSTWPEGIIVDSNLVKLKTHLMLCDNVLQELTTYLFSDSILVRQKKIVFQSKDYLTMLLKEKKYKKSDRNNFAKNSRQFSLDNTDEAARLEITNLHTQVMLWRKQMNAVAFNHLYVVIGSSHQARYREISVQYFDKILSEKSDGSALTENRLVFAESVFNEVGCLSMLARHLIDQEIGLEFFDDRYRMQRDLLSDAATKYLKTIFPDYSKEGKKKK